MKSTTVSQWAGLSAEQRHQYERILLAFQQAWQKEEPPELATFLPAQQPLRAVVLRDLVRLDLEMHRQRGQRFRLDDYLVQFPELRSIGVESLLSGTRTGQPPTRADARTDPDLTVEYQPGPPLSGARWPTLASYEIGEELEHGESCVVHRGQDRRERRSVILKILLPSAPVNRVMLERFLVHFQKLEQLQHPNIVPVSEVGQHHGHPYFAVEDFPAQTLREQLHGRPLSPRRAAALIEVLARALHHAHERGFVHGQLRPSNIRLTSSCQLMDHVDPISGEFQAVRVSSSVLRGLQSSIKIANLGLNWASVAPTPALDEPNPKTPNYLAPEQVKERRPVEPSCDIYALGAILYELLTGRPPFQCDTVAQTLTQILRDRPAPPRLLNSAVAAALEAICLKCLHRRPARRYASAAALAEDLRRFQDGLPVLARGSSFFQHLWNWICPRSKLAATSTISLTVLPGLLGW